MIEARSKHRTYTHLQGLKKVPTDYEITSSELLYYPRLGFEVQSPLAEWFARAQSQSPFRCNDWESFCDPRRTTYTRYVESRREQEIFVDLLFESLDRTHRDTELDPAWRKQLGAELAVLRYPCHAFQMAAACMGHLAPSGKIVICASFQVGDEMRRVQLLARRLGALRKLDPNVAAAGRENWERDSRYQPLRESVERLLVCFDWGEALVALNRVVKPLFEKQYLEPLRVEALRQGDVVTAQSLESLHDNSRWHEEWAHELIAHASTRDHAVAQAVMEWEEKWLRIASAFQGSSESTGRSERRCP
jgi:toluene monooxygenase system protein E